ncbi:MAG: hypothetical protein OHK0039_26620 [Bacteroidia bacterium]
MILTRPSLRSYLLLAGLLFTYSLQAAGIEFFQGTWQQVLDEAKRERKLIFVDAYTVWCGPCKAMARNTFPDEEVGAFFNEHFVSYQFDMEKGEGVEFANRYAVVAYPTLLFINYKGEVVHKAIGYQDPRQLLKEARVAAKPSNNFASLELEYQAGTTDPAVLLPYALTLKEQDKDYREAARRYFATQPEASLLSEQNWKAIQALTTEIDSREFQFLVAKQKKFIKRYGLQPVADKLYGVCKTATIEAALTQQPAKYQAALQVANTYIKDKGQTANRLRMVYAEARKDWSDYAQKAVYHYDTYVMPYAKELNHSASIFVRHIGDPALLQKALDWSRQSIALDNAAYNNETHARLLHKLGQSQEALKYANVALRLATLGQEDTRTLEAFIVELRKNR